MPSLSQRPQAGQPAQVSHPVTTKFRANYEIVEKPEQTRGTVNAGMVILGNKGIRVTRLGKAAVAARAGAIAGLSTALIAGGVYGAIDFGPMGGLVGLLGGGLIGLLCVALMIAVQKQKGHDKEVGDMVLDVRPSRVLFDPGGAVSLELPNGRWLAMEPSEDEFTNILNLLLAAYPKGTQEADLSEWTPGRLKKRRQDIIIAITICTILLAVVGSMLAIFWKDIHHLLR